MDDDTIFMLLFLLRDLEQYENDPIKRSQINILSNKFLRDDPDVQRMKKKYSKWSDSDTESDSESSVEKDEPIIIDTFQNNILHNELNDVKHINLQEKKVQNGGKQNRNSKQTKRNILKTKLNKLKANEIRDVAEKLKIKPEPGRKNITKKYAIDKILRNTRIYDTTIELLK